MKNLCGFSFMYNFDQVVQLPLDQVSISPTFYEKLLRTQISKVQKYSQAVSLFALWGPTHMLMLIKLTSRINLSMFYEQLMCESQKHKKGSVRVKASENVV
jgi:hypothetical protein